MERAVLVLLLCLLLHPAASAGLKQLLPPVDPDYKLYSRMAGLVVPYGYPLEEHFVETVSLLSLPDSQPVPNMCACCIGPQCMTTHTF